MKQWVTAPWGLKEGKDAEKKPKQQVSNQIEDWTSTKWFSSDLIQAERFPERFLQLALLILYIEQ
jgi:hypothetical protein